MISIIICNHGKGFTASLRFDDRSDNIELSSYDKKNLYYKIDSILKKKGLYVGRK